jgi:trimeric autotransporter adhesin
MRKLALGLTVGVALAVGVATSATAYSTSGFSIWTIAGTGGFCSGTNCGNGGSATAAELGAPEGVAVTKSGNVLFTDANGYRVQEITPGGAIKTVAGTGKQCSSGKCGDGGKATKATFGEPSGIAVNKAGDIYIADSDTDTVREINAKTGKISLIAGKLNDPCPTPASCGNGGKATNARLHSPYGLAVSAAGNIYIADQNDNEIREVVVKTGIIKDVAGDGTICSTTPACGDGGSPTTAELSDPTGVAVSGSGNVYIADFADQEVREISAKSHLISRIAGNGAVCTTQPCGDGGKATSATMYYPFDVILNASGDVFVSDEGDYEVREIVPSTKDIVTVAGDGNGCAYAQSACGDGGAATLAQISDPAGLANAPGGGLFIADFADEKVRWLTGPQVSKAVARSSIKGDALLSHR